MVLSARLRTRTRRAYTAPILLKDPEWGKGCIAVIFGVGGFVLLCVIINHFGWTVPRPLGRVLGLLLLLGLTRWILNQIFD